MINLKDGIPEELKDVEKHLSYFIERYNALKNAIEIIPLTEMDEIAICVVEVYNSIKYKRTQQFHPETNKPLTTLQEVIDTLLEFGDVKVKKEPLYTKAKLVKHSTDDGLVAVKDEIKLGKFYIVNLMSIRTDVFFHSISKTKHRKEIIDALPDCLPIPTEILEILPVEQSNLVEIVFTKHATDSGIAVIKEGIPLGSKHIVDLDSIAIRELPNIKTHEIEEVGTILDIFGHPFPTEIIKFVK